MSLNMNSPTVQAMLNNLPQGVGNIPIYYGNQPTVTPMTYPNQQLATPYPSPKEMLIQGGQNAIYQQSQFAPRNIVGAYNPGYQAAFNGYSNPYMGYGYNPYFSPYNQYQYTPLDDDARSRLEAAQFNGVSYDEQLINESNLYKSISRLVSKNLGMSEEDAKSFEDHFDIYNKYKFEENKPANKPVKAMKVSIVRGDEVISTPDTSVITDVRVACPIRSTAHADRLRYMDQMRIMSVVNRNDYIYDHALERQYDNMSLSEFFNGSNCLVSNMVNENLMRNRMSGVSSLYNSAEFKKLLQRNGIKTRDQLTAIERFTGRYGFLPNGMPVSPGHDPSISSSFSYDVKTGQYNVTAPNFIRDRLEKARQSFINSIDNN